jgi:hypothetical protein
MRNTCGIREPGWGAVRIWTLNLAAFLTASVALVTALATLSGFLYTTLLTRRDAVLADLELENRRLENEKLRRDLEQASSSSKPHLDL